MKGQRGETRSSGSRSAHRQLLRRLDEELAHRLAHGRSRDEERDAPAIIEPTDAFIRRSATCICGTDLWPYRGLNVTTAPTPMGHEYYGIVEDVGRAVTSVKPGQFVIGSFFASDNTCPHCRAGYQTACEHKQLMGGAQAPRLRVPLADGTLVATRDVPTSDLVPSMLAASDVLGTGWFAADAGNVKPGATPPKDPVRIWAILAGD